MGWYGSGECKMKFMKRAKIYKNSTGTNVFYPETVRAISYNWWTYLTKQKGLVIFNNYNYSSSTNSHQSATLALMRSLKIKIDVTVYSRKGLQNSEWRIEVFQDVYSRMFLAEYKLNKKGMSKAVKEKQKRIIKTCLNDLKSLKKIQKPKVLNLKLVKIEVIKQYETDLSTKREESKKLRELQKDLRSKTKNELNSLESVDLYDSYDQLNDLKSI